MSIRSFDIRQLTKKSTSQILAVAALTYFLLGLGPLSNGDENGLAALVLGSLCVWITIVDIQRFEVPDLASLLLVVSGIAVHMIQTPWMLSEALIAGVFWGGLFFCVSLVYRHVRGFDGLGFGDVKLMVGIGIWLGFAQTLFVVLASAISGILTILVFARHQGHPLNQSGTDGVAFAPYLCLCAWCLWLYGERS